MTEESIVVSNLTKIYGSFTAVDNLSMIVKKGEFMGLLGPNGAGKSTTLKSITGLVNPTSGEITINGINVRQHKEALAHVGCVIETPECYSNFTPAETLEYIGNIHGMSKDEIRIRARDVLEEMRMWTWRDKNIGKFSKGMRQRVALAAALLPNPDIIILDEPTSGLDPRGMIEVRETLKRLKARDLTLLISTHMLKEVSEMCTTMTMINHGKVVTSGDVNTLIHNIGKGGKGVTIEIRTLKEITDAFISDLSAMTGVSSINRTGDKSLKFEFNGNDEQQYEIVKLIEEYHLGMISMNETGADIESLYMNLTSDSEVSVR